MPKMFSVKGFAAGKHVMPSFGSAAAVIVVSNTAVTVAAPKRAVNSVELQTSATEEVQKESWINVTGSEPTAGVAPHFPLWIRVPRST